jgi:hypothetical protein
MISTVLLPMFTLVPTLRASNYVIVLDVLDKNDALKYMIDQLNHFRWEHANVKFHINQTAYTPIGESPIAVSIETKKDVPSGEPLLQLGIWVAAWNKRMIYLRHVLVFHAIGIIVGNEWWDQRLVSVPLIQVIGHDWKIYFACLDKDNIMLYGPIGIESTDSMVQLYVLMASP